MKCERFVFLKISKSISYFNTMRSCCPFKNAIHSLGVFKKRNISMVFLKTQPTHGVLKNTTYAWRF